MRAALLLLVLSIPLAGCFGGPDESEATPRWEVPGWRTGDTWVYEVWSPGAPTREMSLVVTDAHASFLERDAYALTRSVDGETSFVAASTLNRIDPNGTEDSVYSWPLEEGASWRLESATLGEAAVRAEFVRDIVTPMGLLEGFKITADYESSDLIEVFYYVEQYRSYVRVEDYEGGRLTLLLSLVRHTPG